MPKIIFYLQGKINCSTIRKNNTNNLLQHSPPFTHLESSIRRDFHCESGVAFLRGTVLVQFATACTDLSASPSPWLLISKGYSFCTGLDRWVGFPFVTTLTLVPLTTLSDLLTRFSTTPTLHSPLYFSSSSTRTMSPTSTVLFLLRALHLWNSLRFAKCLFRHQFQKWFNRVLRYLNLSGHCASLTTSSGSIISSGSDLILRP